MAKVMLIVLILLVLSFSITDAASSCYSCSDCGSTWDFTKAKIVTTSNSNDFCRKTVTGNSVNKDFGSSCTPINVLGNGVFCCQSNLCNSANKRAITMINLGLSISLIWTLYHHIY